MRLSRGDRVFRAPRDIFVRDGVRRREGQEARMGSKNRASAVKNIYNPGKM